MTPQELFAWRTREGLSQHDLALLCGVTRQTVAHWETGKHSMRQFLRMRKLLETFLERAKHCEHPNGAPRDLLAEALRSELPMGFVVDFGREEDPMPAVRHVDPRRLSKTMFEAAEKIWGLAHEMLEMAEALKRL